MLGTQSATGAALVEALASAHGADAWGAAVVAGADPAAATRAAVHALVKGAVDGGPAAERAAILDLARSWALSSPGRGVVPAGPGPVAEAFWALPEPLRAALWRADVLGLPGAGPSTAAVARGRIRRTVCGRHRTATAGSDCAATATVLARVLADNAPATKKVLVSRHVAGCDVCAELLTSLRDPAAAVAATLPPAPPDLADQARRAWREHVGAPRRTPVQQVQHAAVAVGRRRQPVAAVLALLAAGTFAAASSQLAASSEGPPLVPLALPIPPAAAPAPPAAVVRRQAIIPPLAADVGRDPRLAALVTPDLAVVTPLAAPPAPLPPPPPPPPPVALAPGSLGEPPPAVERTRTTTVIDLQIPVPVPIGFEIGPSCSSITIGPFSLPLLCER